MKTNILFFALTVSLLVVTILTDKKTAPTRPTINDPGISKEDKKHMPYDHFFFMRNYPDRFDYNTFRSAIEEIVADVSKKDSKALASWLLEGPGNIGGRINKVVTHPSNPDIIFAGNASGGVFKTTNGGSSWYPVFDEHPYLAIGDIVFDPINPSIMYVGTGDPNISGYPFVGNGIYKSTDEGESFEHLGLSDKGIISRICINPANTQIIYAGTMGLPFAPGPDRGLFKSTDGGATWTEILHLSDQAGIIDMVMSHADPNVIYVAGWDRVRNGFQNIAEGPSSKIYKTSDGGTTWTTLSGGLPTVNMSRIGLTMSGTNANLLYAVIVNPENYEVNAVYKTTNGGTSWTNLGKYGIETALSGFGWYFGQIRVNPDNDNELFFLGVDLYKSTDGGNTWNMSGPMWSTYEFHADKHDLIFVDGSTILCSTDGGLYKSTDGGNIWTDIENIPNNQFYRVAVNLTDPGFYGGGVQDNGTVYGNQSTLNEWQRVFGGDGFQMIFHPENPGFFYVEYQYGGLYACDGYEWIDFTYGIDPDDRRCWDMPIIMSKHNYDVLYTGTYRVYKNDYSPYGPWTAISGDLTDGTNDKYHVITAIGESPLTPEKIFAGTSDGRLHRSLDEGGTWEDISAGLPARYVTCIKPSPFNNNVVYVGHSGYKAGENIPHIHRSDNNGNSWTDISGNLPEIAVNDILIMDEFADQVIFAATDGGVYITQNSGTSWERVGDNMPVMPVYDIEFDPINRKLIAGTFARSMMSIAVDSVITISKIPQIHGFENVFSIYPNPASDYLMVDFPTGFSFEIYSIEGKKVMSREGNRNQPIDIKNLKNGIYIIYVKSENQSFTRKFVVE